MPLTNNDISYFKKLLEEIRDELRRISSSKRGINKPVRKDPRKRGRPKKSDKK